MVIVDGAFATSGVLVPGTEGVVVVESGRLLAVPLASTEDPLRGFFWPSVCSFSSHSRNFFSWASLAFLLSNGDYIQRREII